jgi:hypothetical protein
MPLKKKGAVDKTERNLWLMISAILFLAAALAVAWYVYVPDAPVIDNAHVQR